MHQKASSNNKFVFPGERPAQWDVLCNTTIICRPMTTTTVTTTTQQPFYGPLSGTTQVSRYQKKHSPTHHPDHHPIFISFFHLPRSIASSFKLRAWQSFCTTSFHVLFGLPLGLEQWQWVGFNVPLNTLQVISGTVFAGQMTQPTVSKHWRK